MTPCPAALPRRPVRPPRLLALAALITCTLGGAAHAQVSPYYIGGSQLLGYYSNIYRLGEGQTLANTSGTSKSDWVSATSLVAGIDQSFGRQRVYGSGTVGLNRYLHNDKLNGESYNLNLGLDWATINRLSGTVSVAANQSLAQFNAAVVNGAVLTKKNTSKSEQLNARFALGVVTRYTAEATLGYRKQSYSASEYDYLGFNETSGSLGMRYRPSELLSLGVALRLTQADYPRFTATQSDTLKREDIDFTGEWLPSGASSLNVRISPTHTSYAQNTSGNFSGLTGSLGWSWAATGKSKLGATISRDTSQSAQGISLGIFGNGVVNYGTITNAMQLRADHALTGKISLFSTLSLAQRLRDRNAQQGIFGTTSASGKDNSATLALGARWAPTRGSQVGCDVSAERTSSSNKLLSPSLNAAQFSCYGQLTLQSL